MLLRLIVLSSASCCIAKIAENGSLLPVMHIKEVQTGYIAYPDKQLGVDADDVPVTTACTPRIESETSEVQQVHGMLNAEQEGGIPFNDTSTFNGTDVGETFELRTIKPLCDD